MSYRGIPLPRVLRDALERAGHDSLTSLAAAAGIERQTLYAIRCGARRVTPEMAAKIGQVLGVPPGLVSLLFEAKRVRS